MSSWKVDTSTGDYITENGAPVPTDSVSMAAYFRLKIKRNTWLYAPNNEYGSDFHLVKKRPTRGQNQSLENIADRALKPLLDSGRANNIDVSVNTEIATSRSNAILDVSIEDANQKQQDLRLPALLGG